jgi:cob(I)alamin adenosyltransferase
MMPDGQFKAADDEVIPTKKAPHQKRGLLMVYTGHGKGKTTAAFGLAFRALGRGLRVGIVQFIKGKWKTGESLFAGTIPNLDLFLMGRGFTWESDDLSQDKKAAREAWAKAKELIDGGQYDIVILDELTYCIHYNFIEENEILQTLSERPTHVHIVVTGRNAPDKLKDLADLVTEMKSIKHPFEKGVPAQSGIDF